MTESESLFLSTLLQQELDRQTNVLCEARDKGMDSAILATEAATCLIYDIAEKLGLEVG